MGRAGVFTCVLIAVVGGTVVCSGGGDRASPLEPPQGRLVVYGRILASVDSTPLPGVVVRAFQITAANEPDVEVGSATSAGDGSFLISFAARCDRWYGVKVDFPRVIVSCSRCPVFPLPDEACISGNWQVTLWVQ